LRVWVCTDSKISDAGLERLRQALPACHIMDY